MHKMKESTAPRIHLAAYIGGGHPIQKLVLKDKWVSKSRNGARSIHQYQGMGPGASTKIKKWGLGDTQKSRCWPQTSTRQCPTPNIVSQIPGKVTIITWLYLLQVFVYILLTRQLWGKVYICKHFTDLTVLYDNLLSIYCPCKFYNSFIFLSIYDEILYVNSLSFIPMEKN